MIIYRYAAPNQYDQAAYGTQCKVMIKDIIDPFADDVDTYVQVSKDENNPRWEKL